MEEAAEFARTGVLRTNEGGELPTDDELSVLGDVLRFQMARLDSLLPPWTIALENGAAASERAATEQRVVADERRIADTSPQRLGNGGMPFPTRISTSPSAMGTQAFAPPFGAHFGSSLSSGMYTGMAVPVPPPPPPPPPPPTALMASERDRFFLASSRAAPPAPRTVLTRPPVDTNATTYRHVSFFSTNVCGVFTYLLFLYTYIFVVCVWGGTRVQSADEYIGSGLRFARREGR